MGSWPYNQNVNVPFSSLYIINPSRADTKKKQNYFYNTHLLSLSVFSVMRGIQ